MKTISRERFKKLNSNPGNIAIVVLSSKRAYFHVFRILYFHGCKFMLLIYCNFLLVLVYLGFFFDFQSGGSIFNYHLIQTVRYFLCVVADSKKD